MSTTRSIRLATGLFTPLALHSPRFLSTTARPYETTTVTKLIEPSKTTLPPLAVLSRKALLRSLLISFICSKPYLLTPSISFLTLLTNSTSPLLNVKRNKPLGWILKKTLYNQFCTGEDGAEVRQTLREMRGLGFRGTILTYAKEIVFDENKKREHGAGTPTGKDTKRCEGIEFWRKGTLETLDMLGEGDQLAIKLTGAGPRVTEAFTQNKPLPPQMFDALTKLCQKCKSKGVQIMIDAESQRFQDGIAATALDMMRLFNTDGYAVIYNTYQAYLKSTPNLVESHLAAAQEEGFTLGLKLVRGAYMATEPRSVIRDTKDDTDRAYNSIALGAISKKFGAYGTTKPFPSLNLLLAGHNVQSVTMAHELHASRLATGQPTVPLAFAQLHGMADRVSFELLRKEGANVYKCSTWGSLAECVGYLMRRARENKDAAGRTVDEYRALRGELGRRLKAVMWA